MRTDDIFDPKGSACYCGMPLHTFNNERRRGRGPDYIKINRRVHRFRRSDLDRWLASRTVAGGAA